MTNFPNSNVTTIGNGTASIRNGSVGAEPKVSTSTVRTTFLALEVSFQLIEALAPIVPMIERKNRGLADQIQRAATSTSLNLGEGQRSDKGNQHKHYALAHGSANEVKAALHVARAWGWLGETDRPLVILDRLLAILWKLTH